MKEREAAIRICAGRTGVGKSYLTNREIELYAKTHKRPVVIIDINCEQEYAKHKSISIKDLPKVQAGRIYKIQPFAPNGRPLKGKERIQLLGHVLRTFKKGLVVIEDYNKITTTARDKEILESIVTYRHRSQDIIIHLQSASKLDPTLWQNTRFIRWHKQRDRAATYIDRVGNPELILLAEILVNIEYKKYAVNPSDNENAQRYYVLIDMDKDKIYYTDLERFKIACRQYLIQNKREIAEIESELQSEGKPHSFDDVVNDFFDSRKYYVA